MSNHFRVINSITGDVMCDMTSQEGCAKYIDDNSLTVMDRRVYHNLVVVYAMKVMPPGQPQPDIAMWP